MTTRTPSRTAWSPEGDDRRSQRLAAPNTRALRIVPVGRKRIRLALSICEKFRSRGDATELIGRQDCRPADHGSYVQGIRAGRSARANGGMATKIRWADAFAFIIGEYNWESSQASRISPTVSSRSDCAGPPSSQALPPPEQLACASLAWCVTLSEMSVVVVSQYARGTADQKIRRPTTRPTARHATSRPHFGLDLRLGISHLEQ